MAIICPFGSLGCNFHQ